MKASETLDRSAVLTGGALLRAVDCEDDPLAWDVIDGLWVMECVRSEGVIDGAIVEAMDMVLIDCASLLRVLVLLPGSDG